MKDWAIILGASSGIGAECAIRLAKKGINIYGIYLRKKNPYLKGSNQRPKPKPSHKGPRPEKQLSQ